MHPRIPNELVGDLWDSQCTLWEPLLYPVRKLQSKTSGISETSKIPFRTMREEFFSFRGESVIK
jgi:hypothetical protein